MERCDIRLVAKTGGHINFGSDPLHRKVFVTVEIRIYPEENYTGCI